MTDEKKKAWNDLAAAARSYAANQNASTAQTLANAGEAWAQSKKIACAPPVLPFGRSKGTPISRAETKDLEWVAERLRESIDDPGKSRWKAANELLLEEIENELEGR